ncbi:MAG: AAA family ATPase [Bradymonadia bacterium]
MDEILELLHHAAAEARAGQGAVLHLIGAPGLGKSVVLSRFLEVVDNPSDRAAVVSARCDASPQQSPQIKHGRSLVEELVAQVAEGVRAIEVSAEPGADGPRRVLGGPVPLLIPGAQFLAASAPLGAQGAEEAEAVARCTSLLLDITRHHPVVLVIDDAQRADGRSRRIIEQLGQHLADTEGHRLLVVIATAPPLRTGDASTGQPWRPSPEAIIPLSPWGDDEMGAALEARIARLGAPSLAYRQSVLSLAGGNPRMLDALVAISERAGALLRDDDGLITDIDLESRPEAEGIRALAAGRLISMPANIRSDLQTAAVVGHRFSLSLLSRVWGVPGEAARLRVQAMQATGLVMPEGPLNDGHFSFISGEVLATLLAELSAESRQGLHGELGTLLRADGASARTPEALVRPGLDVTETWSETRRKDRHLRAGFEHLWSASVHFAQGKQPAQAAEAAICLAEQLFETSGGYSYLAGRQGRREDRERRHRIYMALSAAEGHLERAKADQWHGALTPAHREELLTLDVRLMVVRTRFKEVLGDFAQARSLAEATVALSGHLAEPLPRLEALRVRVEVCYASGEQSAARLYLEEMFQQLEYLPGEGGVSILVWMAEAVAQWEWVGLHHRVFPRIIAALEARQNPRAALKARIERLACVTEMAPGYADHDTLLQAVCDQASAWEELPYTAELLSAYAAEMIQSIVDAHFDTLSGEFFPPDLYGVGQGPQPPPLEERLQRPLLVMERAADLAQASGHRISMLRVLTTRLGTLYDARERLGELLERWMPLHGDAQAPRLMEMVYLLESGPFSIDLAERLTESVITMAELLELDQVLADTLYEALDRELPVAIRSSHSWFGRAKLAYGRVGDAYGQITLSLVEHRMRARRGEPAAPLLDAAIHQLHSGRHTLSLEQQAFVSMRLGELLLDAGDRPEEAQSHLEQAMMLYEQLGEMNHVQTVGELLSGVYRAAGDLNRYRVLRERFMALEDRLPGVDPLGLEMRIEHLLTRARQEAKEEKAIEMVERCVRLFARMPDGTTRIDECFVEISKICRRRADEAQTEAAFHDWLRRSLAAVETATSINRSLGNHHRLFEEYHELFDDLLGLGDYEAYLKIRAESRELAFDVGHVGELMYLFEEHLQIDPEIGIDPLRLPEIRGFYEALSRVLQGMGLEDESLALKVTFLEFLEVAGLEELSALYS